MAGWFGWVLLLEITVGLLMQLWLGDKLQQQGRIKSFGCLTWAEEAITACLD